MQRILAIFFLIILISCNVPNRIKKNLTLCYDNKTIIEDSTLNLCGYYQMAYVWERDERYTTKGNWVQKLDTLYTNILFYNDGTIIYGFDDVDMDRDNIKAYFEEMKHSKKQTNISPINARYYGIFEIYGDTIKAQFLNNPGLTNTWMAWEKWFLIKDESTIELIAAKRLDIQASSKLRGNHKLIFFESCKRLRASFIPLPYIPSQNPWTKRKAVFWCNKQEYRAYMDSLVD